MGGFASIWETPKSWIGNRFGDLLAAMANPLVTVTVTLLIIAYLAALKWAFTEPKAMTAAEVAEIERMKERDTHHRQIIARARAMVPEFEIQARRDWRQFVRYSSDYAPIRPLLSDEYKRMLNDTHTLHVQGGILDPLADMFLDEVDRLEREWGLS